ncbi:MAG TPA: HAD-IA family hydrolase [Clostridiales bacterium]|nr:HAD-IA family hydrolase [Clostridiales bacterium]
MSQYDTVIFDLDGTLLDTLEDLADSVNHVLFLYGYPLRSMAEIRSFVGNGVRKLMRRAVADPVPDSVFAELFAAFQWYYNAHCAVKTKPYEGIPELLRELKAAGFRLAVVSNKNDAAVKNLIEHFFPGLFDVSIGQREGVPLKPAPDMVEIALTHLGAARRQAIYVGDSEVDSATAANAGLRLILVAWGFGGQKELSLLTPGRLAKDAETLAALILPD